MKFNMIESVKDNWYKLKKYVPLFLTTIATFSAFDKAEAQTSDKFTVKGGPTSSVDVGSGTYNDPWKYKLPIAEEDAVVAQHNRALKDPERLKDDGIKQILEKRAKQRLKVSPEEVEAFDDATDALILSIKTGIVAPAVYSREEAEDEATETVLKQRKN